MDYIPFPDKTLIVGKTAVCINFAVPAYERDVLPSALCVFADAQRHVIKIKAEIHCGSIAIRLANAASANVKQTMVRMSIFVPKL